MSKSSPNSSGPSEDTRNRETREMESVLWEFSWTCVLTKVQQKTKEKKNWDKQFLKSVFQK